MNRMIKQYDKVTLKNGLEAQIVEILADGEMYVADVSVVDGWDEDDTVFVSPDEIATK